MPRKPKSKKQKRRSKSLLGTLNNHKLIISYTDYQGKMYPNYYYYETPKLVKVGDRSSDKLYKTEEERKKAEDEKKCKGKEEQKREERKKEKEAKTGTRRCHGR